VNPESITGGLAGASARRLFKTGVGFVSIGLSTFTGMIQIESGGIGMTANSFPGVSGITVQNGGQFEMVSSNGPVTYNLGTGAALVVNGNGRAGITGAEGALRLDAQVNISPATVSFASAVQLQSTSDIYVDTACNLNLTGTVSGSGGIIKSGPGTLTLSAANFFTGDVTVGSGTLAASARGIGDAMGTSGNLTLVNSIFQLNPITGTTSPTNTSIGNLFVSGGTQVVINWSSTAGNTTLTAASLTRAAATTIVFGSGAGVFDVNTFFVFTNTPATTNGIIPFAVALESSSGSTPSYADFVSVAASNGLAIATYTNQSATSLNAFSATGGTAIFNLDLSVTTSGNRSVGALRVNNSLTNTGNTLTVGTGTAAPIILNGGSILGGTLALNGEGLIYAGGTGTISSSIQGTGGLTAFGNLLNLSGTNTYTGPTTVNGGILWISSDVNLGTAPSSATAGAIVINNATLFISGSTTINANRGMKLGSANSAIVVGSGDSVVYNGIISGPGGLTLAPDGGELTGGGTLTLGGSSTYAGPTIIQGGTLALGTNNALPTGTALTVALGLPGNATFDLAGFSQTISSLSGTSTQVTNSSIFSASTLTINNTEADIVTVPIRSVYNGGLPQTTLNLTKNGNGVLTLAATNTYSGTTTVNAGVLIGTSTAAFGLSGNNLTIGNAAVELNASNFAYSLTAGMLTTTGGAMLSLNYAGAGTITFIAASLAIGSGGTLILNPTEGSLNSTSTFQFISAPTLTNGIVNPAIVVQETNSTNGDFVSLNAGNGVIPATYTNESVTTINNYGATGGTAIQNIDVNVATTANRSVYALRLASTTLTNSANTLTIGNGTGQAGLILNGSSITGGTLSFGGAQGVVYTSNAGGLISSQVTGTAGLIAFGPGTLSLTGNVNVGAAPVNVNGGILRVDGLLTGNVFANNGVVGGNGQIQGNLTVLPSGGVGAGNPSLLASGVLTVAGSVSFQPGASLTVQANGNAPGSAAGQYSQLVIAPGGSINLGTGTTLYVNLGLGYVPAGSDQLYILQNQSGSAVNGAFEGLPQGSSFYVGSSTAYISYTGDYSLGTLTGGNDVVVYFTPTPEPHHVLLIASLTLAIVVFYRRGIRLIYDKA
jgi:fibronectin-binding autotransporter adhesin